MVQSAHVAIDATRHEKEQLAELWSQLGKSRTILIILDNFPETQGLQPWLPPIQAIHVLITTRRRDLNCARIPLGLMTSEEGAKLINSGDRKFGIAAEKLVEPLGGLPLALELTRNYLNYRVSLSIDGLLDEIKKIGEMEALRIFANKYQDELPSGHCKEIAATFQLSWNSASSVAQSLLQGMSLLAPTAVPTRLLRDVIGTEENQGLEDPVDNAISELNIRLSLIELDKNNDPLLHRLIAGFVRCTLQDDDPLKKKVIETILGEMSRIYDGNDTCAYTELEKIVPHVDLILSLDCLDIEEQISLLDALHKHQNNRGRYRLAETYGRKALDLAISHFEQGHPKVAIRQSNLALVLKDLGELEEALALSKEAYDSFLYRFGSDHPHTITTKNNWETIYKMKFP